MTGHAMEHSMYLQNIRSMQQNCKQLDVYLNQLRDELLARVLTETIYSHETNLGAYWLPSLSTMQRATGILLENGWKFFG